jgi:hypothetical protein
MSKKQRRMICRAQKKHGRICPCGTLPMLSQCFSKVGERMVFWYNDENGNTHVVVEESGEIQ